MASVVSHVILIGMMGAGKTTTARSVARLCDIDLVEIDDEIARVLERPAPDVLRENAQLFRDTEQACIEALVARDVPFAGSVGGGALEREKSRKVLRSCTTVWLRAPIEVLCERLAHEADSRPMLDGNMRANLYALYERREPQYGQVASHIIDVEHASPQEVADEVAAYYRATYLKTLSPASPSSVTFLK